MTQAAPVTISETYDVAVVGGGLVGMAVALGLVSRGLRVLVLDGSDTGFRAARANFGLIWIQTKGHQFRPYARLSRRSADLWPEFCSSLQDLTGLDIGYEHQGAYHLCLSEEDWNKRAMIMQKQFDSDLPVAGAYEMVERGRLDKHLPGLGNSVVGGCFCKLDGAVNPLNFYRALHAGYLARGGTYLADRAVQRIEADGGGLRVASGDEVYRADKIVLAAGLGNIDLTPQVGIETGLRPVRGQILVTQKLPPVLKYPTHTIRQMGDGGFILGDSREDVGFDDGTTSKAVSAIARQAIASFPRLAHVQMLRVWGGLRTFTEDGIPLYLRSPKHPNVYALNVHSGVTLAPIHMYDLAAAIESDSVEHVFPEFSRRRI